MGAAKLYNPNTGQWELSTGAIASDVQSVNGFTGNVSITPAGIGAVSSSTIGNLLTENQASVETDLTGFVAAIAHTELTRSSAQSAHGASSIKMATSVEDWVSAIIMGPSDDYALFPIPDGVKQFTFVGKVRAESTTTYSFLYANTFLSDHVTVVGTQQVSTTNAISSTWTEVVLIITPPTNAKYIQIGFAGLHPAVGQAVYWDQLGLWYGSGGEWALPGKPIIGNANTHYADIQRIGNLLTTNQADLETDASAWHASSGCNIGSTTAVSVYGIRSMQIVTTGGNANIEMALPEKVIIEPNTKYTATVSTYSGGASRAFYIGIRFYDVNNAWLTTTLSKAQVTAIGAWKSNSVIADAPWNAKYANVYFYFENCEASEYHFADKLGLWAGSNGEWAIPGRPIIGNASHHYANTNTIGNLLTANQASLETSTPSGWMGWGGGLSLSTSGSAPIEGTQSLLITLANATDAVIQTANAIPVIAGETYTFSCKNIQRAAGWRATDIRIWWENDSVNFATIGHDISTVNGPRTLTAKAPAGATAARVGFVCSGGAPEAGDALLVDGIGFWVGAGGDWQMPGIPIPNQGIRVSRPNIDDYLCEQWSSSEGKWIKTRYDSGVRDVSNLRSTNFPSGQIQIRRTLTELYVWVFGLSGYTFSGDAHILDTPLPVEFRPMPMQGAFYQVDVINNNLFIYNLDGTMQIRNPNSAWATSPTAVLPAQSSIIVPTSLPGSIVSAAPA